VIANRCKSGQQAMGQSEFQKALGRKIDVLIGDESKSFNDAANVGKPLVHSASRSKAAKTLRKVAISIGGDGSDAAGNGPAAKKKSWLGMGKSNSPKPKSKKS